jgi:hypothetical protein
MSGFTPLFAAVVAGKWATAKLILSIAYAQYHPKDPKEKTFKTSDLKFGESRLAIRLIEYQSLVVSQMIILILMMTKTTKALTPTLT